MVNGKSQNGVLLVLVAVAVVVGALVYRSLRSNVPPVPSPPAQPPQAADAKPAPHPVDIDVFVDGSGSIKHFLQTPPLTKGSNEPADARTNYLKDFLVNCEPTLKNAPGDEWTLKLPRFFTFGDHVTQLQGESALRILSDHPESFNAGRTEVEVPVREPARTATSADKPAELKIIVTDLYENGGEMERPADALAAEYLKDDANPGAVAILGVRNPFFGDVEDLPGTPPRQTLPNAADSMPFYVIVAGPAEDVRHCMDVLLDRTRLGEALHNGHAFELFFSRKPQARTRTLPALRPAVYSRIDDNYKDSGIQMISLAHGIIAASWTDRAQDADNQPVALGQNYRLRRSAQRLQPDDTLVDDPAAAAAASPCDDPEAVCEKIDRARLDKGKIYLFRFNQDAMNPAPVLNPGGKLLADWNIETADAEQISQRTKQFPLDKSIGGRPGKTPDLSLFLRSLQGQMFHSPVPIASYYLYVQAN